MSAVLRPTFCTVLFCIVFTIFNLFSVRPTFIHVNCWLVLLQADLTTNYELSTEGQAIYITISTTYR